MRKKSKKTNEQATAEEFFPVNEGDLRHAVEKEIKIPEMDTLEILKKGKSKTGKPRRKYTKKTRATGGKTEYSPLEKINLKKDGYELIITEKPQAALKIADSLGKSAKRNSSGVPYYELERGGKEIIVACAVGHLLTLSQKKSNSNMLPVFDIQWVPNFLARKNDFTKKYYDTILKLAKKAGSITIATDYDVEGEVIGLNIVKHICGQEDAQRMKFSTLTAGELEKSYDLKFQTLNWGHAIAGETRHYLDWFYGINLSRALMNAIKSAGKFRIMSIGRVQGPALELIVKKEKEIQAFKSQSYWQVFITVKNSHTLELRHNKDIFRKQELGKFEKLKGKTATAETKKTEQILQPNPPFDLTSLQTEAYRLHGITPARTLQLAQSLYLAGLISYPRTSSQKLPDSVDYKSILNKLAGKYRAEKLITRQKPIEGKKSDPAHPSIYPTGESQVLSGEEEKIYNLIVKRFLSLFCDNAIIDNKTVRVTAEGLVFTAKGTSVRKKGWMEIYPVKIEEKDIPDLEGEVKIINVRTEEKETQPPRRYSPASIVSELEKKNLGTKATRANIIETLYDRGYIREKSIEATPLGISLVETLEKYSPVIIDEELTRDFEKEMDSISQSKKNFGEKQEKIIDKAKETIRKIIMQFEEKEKNIGEELTKANEKFIKQEREENKLNICPVCKKGNLAIIYSKKTRRYFVACNAYPECKTTYSLPPNGLIKPVTPRKTCEQCGFPMLMSIRKGKRPWIFCFNRECETNKKRLEEYREKQNKEKEEEGK